MHTISARMRPTFSGGRWHKPRVSARQAAMLRKQAVLGGQGAEWPQAAAKPLHINPLAGRKQNLHRPDRFAPSLLLVQRSRRRRCSPLTKRARTG